MDASRPSFLQRSRYALTPSEPVNDEEEVTDLPIPAPSDAAQPTTPDAAVARHLQRLLSTPTIVEEDAADLTSTASPIPSAARHARSSSATPATAPSSSHPPLTPSSSDGDSGDDGEDDEEDADHLIDEHGRVRRYIKRPSITINGENALQHQDILVPTSPLTPVSPVITAVLAASAPPTLFQRWLGFIMLATSALCFSLMSLFVSLTGGRVNSFLLVWWRCLVQFSIAVAILLIRRVDIRGPKGVRRWIFARGAVGICSLSCFYFALTSLPLSEATVLFFTAPLFVAALSRVVLNESFDRYDALASACSFIGVVFVARPSVIFGTNADDKSVDASSSQRNFSIFIALLGAHTPVPLRTAPVSTLSSPVFSCVSPRCCVCRCLHQRVGLHLYQESGQGHRPSCTSALLGVDGCAVCAVRRHRGDVEHAAGPGPSVHALPGPVRVRRTIPLQRRRAEGEGGRQQPHTQSRRQTHNTTHTAQPHRTHRQPSTPHAAPATGAH